MSIDAAAFKKGMRHLAASVTLITTKVQDQRGGLTATAVCSVSAEPPQILVCVNKSASAHDPIGEAGFPGGRIDRQLSAMDRLAVLLLLIIASS